MYAKTPNHAARPRPWRWKPTDRRVVSMSIFRPCTTHSKTRGRMTNQSHLPNSLASKPSPFHSILRDIKTTYQPSMTQHSKEGCLISAGSGEDLRVRNRTNRLVTMIPSPIDTVDNHPFDKMDEVTSTLPYTTANPHRKGSTQGFDTVQLPEQG